MALQVENITRTFEFTKGSEKIQLADPNPDFTPKEVMSFYANTYSELTTASIELDKTSGGKAIYIMKTNVGTKG